MHLAKCEADGFGSTEVSTEHILLALLNDPALVRDCMQGVSESEIRDAINVRIPRGEVNPLPHDLPLSKEARTGVVLAREEADKLGQRYVQNEHVLLALVQSTSFAAQLLSQKGLSADKLRLHIKTLPQPEEGYKPPIKSKESAAEVELIRKVGELVSRRKGQKALQLLDDFMSEPGQDRKLRMRMMGHFAAITALQIGDLSTAQRYCEERLAYSPEDPMALYALADCLARQGHIDEAKRRAADSVRRHCQEVTKLGKVLLN